MSDRIVIIGGGVVGASIALHLRRRAPGREVTVLERDPSYRRASSWLAFGGIRQQFDLPANIRLAQHSVRMYRRFAADIGSLGPGSAGFQPRGYLFLVDEASAERFEARMDRQREAGAHVARLERDQIRRLVPDLVLDDIEFGTFGPQDGYANPRAVLSWLRHAAEAAGARFLADTVTGLAAGSSSPLDVSCASGQRLPAGAVVCAAGAFSAAIGRLVGLDLPIQPVRQQLFRCALPRVWPYRFPVVVDPCGLHWRHEDPAPPGNVDRIVVARRHPDEPVGENLECDTSRWIPDFRDPLVRRLPALAEATLVEGWAGLYEMTPDHNPLLGAHPDVPGLFLAAGFSGHGLMMAPAVGQALAELITTGASTALDISGFDPCRFERGRPLVDDAIL